MIQVAKKNFRELRTQVRSDPARAKRVADHRVMLEIAQELGALRERAKTTQTELASRMNVSQENISRIEHAQDLQLSTLARYVAALGGRVEVNAVFDDEVIRLAEVED